MKKNNTITIKKEEDKPLNLSKFILNGNECSIFFDNGLNVRLGFEVGIAKYEVFTPNKDITHRFKVLAHGRAYVNNPSELLRILNAVDNLPNTYTIHEIPDSCFNFEDSGTKN